MSIEYAETYFNDRGLVLIQGKNEDADAFESNGAGKSTLFSEAPTWALFGETIRGQKGDAVINRKVGRNTRVTLEIVDDNGDVYEIIRHRRHRQHKNHVLLYRNGENITSKSDTDTNKAIEDLLQMDFLTFTNSIMFGQGVSKMFALSTDSEQKKILERMLQIDIFKACQERAKQYLSNTQASIDKLQGEIDSLTKEKSTLKQSIEELQRKEAELEQKVTERIKELQGEKEEMLAELESLDDIGALEEDKKVMENALKKVQQKLDSFKKYEESMADLLGDKKSLQRDMNSIRKELDKKRAELADILSGKNIPKICEACGQELPLEDTTHIENHLRESMKKLEREWQEKKDELDEVEGLLNKLHTVLEGKKPLEEQKQQLQDSIRDIYIDIKHVENKQKSLSKAIERIDKQIEEQEALLGTTYTDLIESNIEKIKEIDKSLEVKEVEMSHLQKDLQHYNFWVNAYGNQGIKSVLLDSITPFLNKRANYYLSKLADSSIEVTFNTQVELKSGEKRDKFSVDVVNSNGDNDYKGNSNGEKRRIDIAINMALQDLVSSRSNKRIDLIVYDEVFEGLDSIGCEAVIQLLTEKAKVFGTVMVITHNDNLKQLFSKSLTVTKRNGRTVVEDED
jgi:DNA repair exonuclease SbcCD ATPase subunit